MERVEERIEERIEEGILPFMSLSNSRQVKVHVFALSE